MLPIRDPLIQRVRDSFRSFGLCLVLVLFLCCAQPRRSNAEDQVEFKTLYYTEDNNRMTIVAPAVLIERELDSGLTIKVEGIYNSISGASPTGAPPYQNVTVTRYVPGTGTAGGGTIGGGIVDDNDDEGEEDDRKMRVPRRSTIRRLHAAAGATPAAGGSTSSGGSSSSGGSVVTSTTTEAVPIPTADVEDTRVGLTLEASQKIGRHTPAVQFAYSDEQDYTSVGLSVRDAIDFNHKNTTLLVGGAYTADVIDPKTFTDKEAKDSVDMMLGITQVLDRRTLLTVNLTAGIVDGFIADPYKVVSLNGERVSEKRPDHKDKQVFYASLTRFVDAANGSMEMSYRRYHDTFGIDADTFALAWYQKFGDRWIVRPAVRYYTQTAADFFGNTFTGAPEFYSADYRVSAFHDVGYGLKVIWTPTRTFSLDVAFERYEQSGAGLAAPAEAYPSASLVLAGIRWWL